MSDAAARRVQDVAAAARRVKTAQEAVEGFQVSLKMAFRAPMDEDDEVVLLRQLKKIQEQLADSARTFADLDKILRQAQNAPDWSPR